MKHLSETFNRDCVDAMKEYPDNYFDIGITSPPYNLGNNHHTGSKRFLPYDDDKPEKEYQNEQIKVLNELYRVFKNGGSLFYNHKNRIKKGKQITPYEWLLKTKWDIKQEIVWFNRSQNFDKCRFYPMTERVYWLSKGVNTNFNNNINHHDLFNWESVGTDGLHKRAFPKQMVKDLLMCFPRGLKVIDPYSGSGTTRIVAYELGFDFTGFELDKVYFEQGNKRFNDFLTVYEQEVGKEKILNNQTRLF
jgi:modification methylase